MDSLIETEAETLVEVLVDSEALIESETDWLVDTEALVLVDSLNETEALVEAETEFETD